MAKSSGLTALEYLLQPNRHILGAICVVFGDEAFLKRETLTTIRQQIGTSEDDEYSLSIYSGREVEWKDVRDSLTAVSLFGEGRTSVIVEDADTFVSQYRGELEEYLSKPARGLLVLEVKSWPSNTRLAKAVVAMQTAKDENLRGTAIECKSPTEAKARGWLTKLAQSEFGVKLQATAADVLFDRVPPELGILKQEIAKLSLLTDESKSISASLVEEHVGGWRSRTAWEMIDSIAMGDAKTSLEQLERLIAAGEEPIGLLAQLASTLRRFATAAEAIQVGEVRGQKRSIKSALQQAGVKPFKIADTERQLRQIGRERATQLHQWLLDIDLAMKGYSSERTRARVELERLIVRLSREAAGADRQKQTVQS